MHYLDESHIFIFLTQLFIILFLCRGIGSIFQKFGQPTLTAELLIGIILGPTIFGRFFPYFYNKIFPDDILQRNMLETVSWVGVLFLLLQTGLEIDFSIAWRQRGKALLIAISDIIIPMIFAFIFALFLPDKYLVNTSQKIIFCFFIATVMTISALPVTAKILHELNILKTNMGFLIMSALTVNDIIGWVIFTIVLGIFTQVEVSVSSSLFKVLATVGFAFIAIFFGRHLSTKILSFLQKKKFPEPATSLTFACLLGFLFGAITQKIGIHALFGFFIAGVIVGESKVLSEDSRTIISQMVYSIFVPVFFVNIGLKVDFIKHFDLSLVILMTVIGILGRYIGAWIGVLLTKTASVNRHLISLAHIPGGMMEIVVSIIALEAGMITEEVFEAIVFSAIFSSVVLGPLMKSALKKRRTISLYNYMLEDAIVMNLKGKDKKTVIEELLIKILPKEKDKILSLIMKREEEFGTAIGKNIAIPHIHISDLKSPLIAFGHSLEGIEWNSPDGKPVNYVFLVLVPEDLEDIHVQFLSLISKFMQKELVAQKINSAKDPSELHSVFSESF